MTLKRRGKRVICLGMMILLMLLCACTNEQKPADDINSVGEKTENYEIPKAYTEVLDAYAKLLLGTGEITEMTGPVGINSAIDLLSALDGAAMAAEAPYRCGYLLKDLNDDGVPELLIGEISAAGKYEQENGVSYSGSIVQAVYTLADGEALNILEGWGRNRYDWTDTFLTGLPRAPHIIFSPITSFRRTAGGWTATATGLPTIRRTVTRSGCSTITIQAESGIRRLPSKSVRTSFKVQRRSWKRRLPCFR